MSEWDLNGELKNPIMYDMHVSLAGLEKSSFQCLHFFFLFIIPAKMLISEINGVWQLDQYGSTTFVYHFLFSDILTSADQVAENIFQYEITDFGNNHAQL